MLQAGLDQGEETEESSANGLTPLSVCLVSWQHSCSMTVRSVMTQPYLLLRLYAVHLGKQDMVAALLAANADANATSRSGDTALHLAAYKVQGLYFGTIFVLWVLSAKWIM